MNIALMHFRVGETDGVSLEMEKWKTVLSQMGHTVYYIAEKPGEDTYAIPELDIRSASHKKIFHNAYEAFEDYDSESEFKSVIEAMADRIHAKLLELIDTLELDLIVVNNVSSLGLHLPAGLAIDKLQKKNIVDIAYHHHDFYWERERYAHPTVPYVASLLDKAFPPLAKDARHFVINKIAQKELKKRKGIDATVIPNVFDFERKAWDKDDFNKDLRERLDIKDNDIVLLQATRIEDRKAIEFAVYLADHMQTEIRQFVGRTLFSGETVGEDSLVHLVIAGMNEMKADRYAKLKALFEGKSAKVHLINDSVESMRRASPEKKYSLWDVYTMADAITYPSILEGWGNQLIEAIFAKKPIVLYEYPVYKTDIAPLDFKVITLGDTFHTDDNGLYTLDANAYSRAADKLWDVLFDKEQYETMVEHNYAVGKQQLSYSKLQKLLKDHLLN
ncbi:MAG: glycosyltransferase [Candidatus Izemoplasmataceae bacterium]